MPVSRDASEAELVEAMNDRPFGLGRLIMTTRSMFEHDRMFATVLWTLLFAGMALTALARVEARLLRWRT